MKSTSIGIQFDVIDLDAKYEVIGTSDNYSFQYDLGRGDSLVDFEGETAQKTISLKGNYGFFNIRIFAVSDIGIRSAFIETGIAINSPDYNGTFSFSDISVSNLPSSARVGSEIEIEPNGTGILAVRSEYIGRDIDLEWSLLPPNGHAKEGEPLNTELLSDTLFQDFSLSLFDENGGIITDSELNSSEPLQDYLGTSNVSDAMNSYRGFSFQISNEILTDLNLGRTFGIEVVSNDSYGRASTGILTGINYLPEIDSFSYDLRGSKFFMSWDSLDTDSSTMSIYSLELPEENYIKYPRDIIRSASYYDSLFRAPAWTKQNYSAGNKVIFGENVYECISGYNHLDNPDRNPRDQGYWSGCGPVIPHSFLKDDSKPKEFVADQTWGQNYYYAFVPNDGFGPGQTFNLTEDGLIESGELNSDLEPFKSNVKIDNLSFREREDDFVFKWNITDQDGNLVDLNTYKFLVGNTDTPSVLGISGSLFDADSRSFLTGITEGMNSRTSVTVDGVQSVVENLPGATVFDSYEYTRDLNNEIYGSEDFPEASNFDGTLDYNVGDNIIFLGGELHTSLIESPQGNNIRPGYFTWNNSKDYIYNQPFSSGEEGEFISDGHFFYLCINDSHDWRKFPVTPVIKGAAVAGSLDYDDRYFYICEGGTQWARFPVATTEARDPAVLNDIYTDPFINLYSEDHFLYVNYQDEWFRAPMIEVDAGDSFSDRAMYDGGVYISTGIDNGTVGPGSESVLGVYNEYLNYSSGSLVISPDRLDIELFSDQIDYNEGELVLFSGTIYRCESITLSGNATLPSSSISNWVPDGAFVNVDANIYKANQQIDLASTELPSSNSAMWELQTPSNSDHFELLIPGYGLSMADYSEDDTYLPGDLVIYENNIWSGAKENGVGISAGVQYPSMSNREYWASGPEHSNYRGVWNESTFYNPQDVVFENTVHEGFPELSGPKFYKALVSTYGGSAPEAHIRFGGSNWVEEPATDFSTNHQIDDIVISNDTVYKCLANNPTGAPISAIKGNPELINSDYISSQWQPFWERNPSFEGVIFGHIGIPESGKRSIGLELGILDLNGDVLNLRKIEAFNPEPSITRNSFQVDSTSRTAQTTFNFNYANASREQVTSVQLYRSNVPNFEVTGVDRLPGTGAESFVSEIMGPGDATFGENITSITDSPPIPNTPGVGEEPTGYFYKILPFDAFGSGDLYNVNHDGDPTIIYPINWSNQNPNGYNGPIYSATEDYIPGTPINFEVDGAFKNYFLSWNTPDSQFLDSTNQIIDITPQDISYYEVWESDQPYLEFGAENRFLEIQENSSGYRRITADAASVGPIPRALQDDASGITNAVNVMTIDAISPKIQASHPGETNETAYFWVRAVDSAGNKSPFTGKANSDPTSTEGNRVEGFEFTLGQAESTDIADFERSITESFPNVLALAPNNPFYDGAGGVVGWSRHLLFSNGVGYVVGAGNASNTQKYIYAGLGDPNEFSDPISSGMSGVLNLIDSDGNPEFPRRNILYSGNYEVSEYHPAGAGEPGTNGYQPPLIDDGDFIIARNDNGIAVPMWHAFANATIGSAHIEDAAISSAKINSLSADKIRSATIEGQDIQVGGEGAIRSAGFHDIDHSQSAISGFMLSGDGSFAFQQGDSSLGFENGSLVLRGNIRQSNGDDYDFIDIDVSPGNFNYVETGNGGYARTQGQEVTFSLEFRNSSIISSDEILVKAYGIATNGAEYSLGSISSYTGLPDVSSEFTTDHAGGGFEFVAGSFVPVSATSTSAQAELTLNSDAFDSVLNYAAGTTEGEAFVLYAKSKHSNFQKKMSVGKIDDGLVGTSVNVIFKRSATAPSAPSDSSGVPTSQGWYDSAPTGTGTLWASTGKTQLGSNLFEWASPFQIEGHAVAEVYAYILSSTTPSSLSPNISGNYNFTNNTYTVTGAGGLNLPGINWEKEPPGITANNDKVWVVIGLAHGSATDTSRPISWGATPTIYAQRTDGVGGVDGVDGAGGADGPAGRSVTYMGEWVVGTMYTYIAPTSTTIGRGDVVYHHDGQTGAYYIAKQTSTVSGNATKPNTTGGNAYWQSFGGVFKSVATDILLAQEAYITDTLIIGKPSDDGSIISNGFRGGGYDPLGLASSVSSYDVPGFLLGRDGSNNVTFDVGGPMKNISGVNTGYHSYIRFDSTSGKIVISATSFDGSLDISGGGGSYAGGSAQTTSAEKAQILADFAKADRFATFIGGGFNNSILAMSYPDSVGNMTTAASLGCAIVGGGENTIKGSFSTIGGGYLNEIESDFAAIVCGYSNYIMPSSASEGASVIAAGQHNVIRGGSNNSILGGANNTINSLYSINKYHYGYFGTFVRSDANYLLSGRFFGIGREWEYGRSFAGDEYLYMSLPELTWSSNADNGRVRARSGVGNHEGIQNYIFKVNPNYGGNIAQKTALVAPGGSYPWTVDDTHSSHGITSGSFTPLYWRMTNPAYSAPYYAGMKWISNSWMTRSLSGSEGSMFVAQSSGGSALDPTDGRTPIKRKLGWCFLNNLGGVVQTWAYVVVSGTDYSNPEAWIYISNLPTYGVGNSNTHMARSGWFWISYETFYEDPKRYLYLGSGATPGWVRLIN